MVKGVTPPGGGGLLPERPGVRFGPVADGSVYAVGDDGSVWSSATRSGARSPGWWPVSPYRRPYGARYFVVCLRADDGRGKVICRYVHRLVLEAFVGPCPDGLEECRHLDGDTANNHLTNLAWGTRLDNAADRDRHGTQHRGSGSPRATLDTVDVACVFLMRAAGYTQSEIAAEVGPDQSSVGLVLRGRTYVREGEILRTAALRLAERGVLFDKRHLI